MNRSISRVSNQVAKGSPKEAGEFGLGHLARCHGEFPVLDRAAAADMTLYRHVVGRVREDHLRLLALHKRRNSIWIESVAADQPVGSQRPDVAPPAQSRSFLRDTIILGIARLLWDQPLDEVVNLGDREAGEADVKVDIARDQGLKLAGQDFVIPAGIERDLV